MPAKQKRPVAKVPVVAVFNSNDDVLGLLRITLQQAGLIVVTGHIAAIRDGTLDLLTFVQQHQPRVIVYDIVPPYEANWSFLNHLRASDAMRGRHFVLTSTNPQRVTELVGTTEAVYEIVGKPYDLDRITQAVREASRARPTRNG